MIILPAIDLKNGKCVRLYQGKISSSQVVADSAVDTALKFKEMGAKNLHIVDLDGAFSGELKNLDVVEKIVKKVDIPIELGGGIRDIETIEAILKKGVNKVILGTSALKKPNMVKEAIKKYGDKIIVGIDAKNEMVSTEGWVDVSSVNYIDFAKEMEKLEVKTIVFTDISKDGALKGPNFNQIYKLKEKVSCNIIASGGVTSIEDITKLRDMNLYGAIVGKAIYSGNVNLKQAVNLCKRGE
ncbi:1-(5-phosphoribosyl)-5-[(5-phosphoribosylamino)methylideneamino] imidazole-4-carboxamide isomerase [Clostridium acetireducens DSM 10703]|jgi:phosphoribosylformimino-5-aminoimidazole carboxamide ribotide isomerase|uniref:1-(5-phosphoribosyl)-5-[(5-phosphoribosylamino)methylideneamino] imidazole-4-carboxamide isomerase n=1 Tax=Clostridium acetireducens DSM 10703 TaxID=1121290 RepID=A0A1E8EX79_9CLOT|nr:1-(5-phosphoribosyl)-5-[(5-phosphoribosylamino)methylideneamino]imidazole-4-carboxamide isomerase [Clostridium acetireducens]OFI05361.1 1-(5-phosphoribosyl)-5-[(5-phosphoribosylamino)methylideneamino] imidazole-4-carboxamide isomerase [Clostridium acetireducens DSM 10703]